MITGFYNSSPPEIQTQTLSDSGNPLQIPDSVSAGSPVMVLIIMIGILYALKIVGDSPKSGIEPGHIFVGSYNLILVTITSILGISLAKIIFNQFHVPGLTDIINSV